MRDLIFSAFEYSLPMRSRLRLELTLFILRKMRLFSRSVSMILRLATVLGKGGGGRSAGARREAKGEREAKGLACSSFRRNLRFDCAIW